MVVTLYTEEIVSNIRGISHHEVAEIPDVEARYRGEAGSEKFPLIYRGISEGVGRLLRRCHRFLKGGYYISSDNAGEIPPEMTFDFNISERRAVGKSEMLAKAMNDFVLHYALSQFYSDVSQSELSNKHSLAAIDAGNELDMILYSKLPPIL